MKKLYLSILSFTAICFLNSCYYDNFKELHPEGALNNNGCDTAGVISYSAQIVPLLANSCTGSCHNGSGSGHDMKTWAAVNFDAVDPGGSKLVGSVTWDGVARQMPEGGTSKISDCDITKIKKWVSAGAPNN
jgi:hypothetical protein